MTNEQRIAELERRVARLERATEYAPYQDKLVALREIRADVCAAIRLDRERLIGEFHD